MVLVERNSVGSQAVAILRNTDQISSRCCEDVCALCTSTANGDHGCEERRVIDLNIEVHIAIASSSSSWQPCSSRRVIVHIDPKATICRYVQGTRIAFIHTPSKRPQRALQSNTYTLSKRKTFAGGMGMGLKGTRKRGYLQTPAPPEKFCV